MWLVQQNITRDMCCKICGGSYCSTLDFEVHLSGEYHKNAKANPVNSAEGKLTPNDLNKLPWRAFRSGKGWGIRLNVAPYLVEAINNGSNIFGDYKYYLLHDAKLVGRSLIKKGCF